MSQSGPLPYLNVSGIEIANAARTVSYLRNGLGDTDQGHWELGSGDVCSVLYRLDAVVSGGQYFGGLYFGQYATTAVADIAPFVSPADDAAPWYDPDEPGSETFLGLLLLDFTGYDSTIKRSVANRLAGLQGGIFSRQQRIPRTWKFRAAMASSDAAGAEYGLRWLTKALQATPCDVCDTGTLTVRLACPPADGSDDALGEWTSYEVALTDGPNEVEKFAPGAYPDSLAGCRDLVTVEFTLVAGNPFLYKRAESCAQFSVTSDGLSTLHCCSIDAPRIGVLGSIFAITATLEAGPCSLEMYGSYASDGGCDDLTASMNLTGIPADSTVIVDSARHIITVVTVDPITGDETVSDGFHLLDIPEGETLTWLEARNCDNLGCFCFRFDESAASGVTVNVAIDTQAREG